MLAQSAMEYLLTYGWALLIISIVLSTFYYLNVFSAGTLTPKVGPGACLVARPGGPYSTSILNLQGLCNGEIPDYVYLFPCSWPNPSYCPANWISFTLSKTPGSITVSSWFWVPPSNASIRYGGVIFAMSGNSPTVWVGGYSKNGRNIIGQHLCAAVFDVNGAFACSANNITTGKWHNAVVTINDSKMDVYLDTVLVGTGAGGGLGGANSGYIGNQTCNCFFYGSANILALYTGYMANVQLYNSSLAPSYIDYMYSQGIGGAPGNLQNLAGWWPMNGNPNDYSGNLQDGYPSNIIPSASWYDTYIT